jgi:anthranilate/para-aminobenzoate synthase component II
MRHKTLPVISVQYHPEAAQALTMRNIISEIRGVDGEKRRTWR